MAAFQEIDRNSSRNGRFNHTAFLAEGANYPHHFSDSHIDGNNLQYGTALVAQLALIEPTSIKFSKPFARLSKAYVVSMARWPGSESIDVDIASVHFDFLTGNPRLKEAMKLLETFKGRNNPRVIMSDLNSEYAADNQLITLLEDSQGLSTWQPHVEVVTLPKLQKRLDWVLVSRDIEIVTLEVSPDPLSDHRAIVAELQFLEI